MSIASELVDLANNKAAIKAAIESKSPATAPTNALSQWPTSIASISTAPVQDDWYLPPGWPDLRKVLENDPFKNTSGILSRVAILIEVNSQTNLPDIFSSLSTTDYGVFCMANAGAYISGGRSSNDPDTYVQLNPYSNVNWSVNWDPAKYIVGVDGHKFVWLEFYSINEYLVLFDNNNRYPGLKWICGDGNHYGSFGLRFFTNVEAVTGFKHIKTGGYNFELCQFQTIPPIMANTQSTNLVYILDYSSLKRIKFAEDGKPLQATDWSGAFRGMSNLQEFPDIFFEGNTVANAYTVCYECWGIKYYPDTMDFSSLTANQARIWQDCITLRGKPVKLPTKTIWPNIDTVHLGNQPDYLPYTVAQFDENDNLVGGWLFGWQKCAAQSTTLNINWNNSSLSWMTSAQKQKVKDFLLNQKDINIINFPT